MMVLELLRARSNVAVARAYDGAFDPALKLLLESDVEQWRVEAVDALCELVHFLDKEGHANIVAELAARDWLMEAIQEATEEDAPACLENGCRFLTERFIPHMADAV
jgi:hypothetical protein